MAEVQGARQEPSTQSLPAAHCPAPVHVASGRGRHRLLEHMCEAEQSESDAQPRTHAPLMQYWPEAQSVLRTHAAVPASEGGVPASEAGGVQVPPSGGRVPPSGGRVPPSEDVPPSVGLPFTWQ